MSDHIPREVMANILLRLRVNDLVRCRRVSKFWLSVIDDPDFISRQLQLSISTNSNAALLLQERGSPDLWWRQNYGSDDSGFFSSPTEGEPDEVWLMGSCHGLICFSLEEYPHDFVVLNPSTGERHTVSRLVQEERVGDKVKAYGFGYDESSDDYKVVRVIQTEIGRYSYCPRVEIYSVRSKGFSSTIPLPSAYWKHNDRKSIGVFVHGSIHWYYRLEPDEHVIHAIDLVSNTYSQLQWPHHKFSPMDFACLNLGVIDTRLCLCAFLEDMSKIGIWVMEEYGNPESWNRLYCFGYDQWNHRSVTSVGSNRDKILLMIDWHIFAWFDPMKRPDETISTDDDTDWRYYETYHPMNIWERRSHRYEALYCLESLVKIFPNKASDHVNKDA
ncbi:F-box protein CPR1 [Linum perenne]